MNAVAMYKFLAEKMPSEELKATVLSIAADEGRHAALCKAQTEVVMKPTKQMVNLAKGGLIFGKKFLFSSIAVFEKLAAKLYLKIADVYPFVQDIMADERRHAEAIKEIKKGL